MKTIGETLKELKDSNELHKAAAWCSEEDCFWDGRIDAVKMLKSHDYTNIYTLTEWLDHMELQFNLRKDAPMDANQRMYWAGYNSIRREINHLLDLE